MASAGPRGERLRRDEREAEHEAAGDVQDAEGPGLEREDVQDEQMEDREPDRERGEHEADGSGQKTLVRRPRLLVDTRRVDDHPLGVASGLGHPRSSPAR
jgi:hypothetical protein